MKSISKFTGSKTRTWMTASLLAALVAACGGSDGGGSAPGTLGVSLTDAPACGFDAVNVTVTKVRINQSSSANENDGGWTDITLNPARKINLLDWNNGGLTALGETPLAAGHYSQLRLVLDPNTSNGFANSVVPTGGIETALVTPSAVQSGIKLVNEFDVASGQRVDLLMDFDACKSIVLRGNGVYALKPVIKVVPFVLNGINGFVDIAMLGSGVMVTAQQNGVIVQTTAPNTTTGEFFLARLPVGSYDVVLTANGRSTAVIAGVPVETETSVVPVSNTVTRIMMPVSLTGTVSGTAVLDPASTTELAYVAAKQTFGTAPTVTVKSVAVDEVNGGTYSLSLPIGEPLLGQFGTGMLPVDLPMQEGLAGMYGVAASATGYVTQSVNEEIFVADATQAFVLVPPLAP